MRDVLCPIDCKKSSRRLVVEQNKCFSNKGYPSGHINEQKDSHDKVQNKKRSPLAHPARIDVSCGQKKVNWGNDERYDRDGQRGRSPKSLFCVGWEFEIPTDAVQPTEDDTEQREDDHS